MGLFGLIKKRFKRRMRLKRRMLSLGALLLATGSLFAYAATIGVERSSERGPGPAAEAAFGQQSVPGSPAELRSPASVTVRRVYVCGEELEFLGTLAPDRIAELSAEHPGWEFAAGERADEVTFVEHIDDLSPACKSNAYMGMDEKGNLTMFEGPPNERRALRTFFQLDIEHLESALPPAVVRQLRSGIRIADFSEYSSVLSTFSDYAVDETANVLKLNLP